MKAAGMALRCTREKTKVPSVGGFRPRCSARLREGGRLSAHGRFQRLFACVAVGLLPTLEWCPWQHLVCTWYADLNFFLRLFNYAYLELQSLPNGQGIEHWGSPEREC